MVDGIYQPKHIPKGIISADAFRLERTEGGKMSDGGIAGKLFHDEEIDPKTKDVSQYLSDRFCLDYYVKKTMILQI